MSQMIELKNVCYIYPDGNQALVDVSLAIQSGQSLGIVGANGSGKSTLLSLLLGILWPSQGEIIVGDTHLTKKTVAKVREQLGLVFQDSDDQLFMPSVFDDVAFGPRNLNLSEDEIQSRVQAALSQVGITHLSDRPPFRLSGGEKKSAAIASVLSMKPEVLILDEPTSGLDPKARRKLIDFLKAYSQTKIITSHDLEFILEVSSQLIVLHDGQMVASGNPREILSDKALMEQSGLEVPLSLKIT